MRIYSPTWASRSRPTTPENGARIFESSNSISALSRLACDRISRAWATATNPRFRRTSCSASSNRACEKAALSRRLRRRSSACSAVDRAGGRRLQICLRLVPFSLAQIGVGLQPCRVEFRDQVAPLDPVADHRMDAKDGAGHLGRDDCLACHDATDHRRGLRHRLANDRVDMHQRRRLVLSGGRRCRDQRENDRCGRLAAAHAEDPNHHRIPLGRPLAGSSHPESNRLSRFQPAPCKIGRIRRPSRRLGGRLGRGAEFVLNASQITCNVTRPGRSRAWHNEFREAD